MPNARTWRLSRLARFMAAEADIGPFLLAAYGQDRRFCWEVAFGGPHGRILAHGVARSLDAARAAAEAAALDQLAAPTRDVARGLPPAPVCWH